MKKIPKQEYTAEFRELAVKRVKDGLTPGAAAKEFGVNHQTLRNWIKAAAAGKLGGVLATRSSRRSRWSSPGCVPRTSGLSGSVKS